MMIISLVVILIFIQAGVLYAILAFEKVATWITIY